MSTTDTDETRANQDPREEPEWSSDEGGFAQHEAMRQGFESADQEDADDEDEGDEGGAEAEAEVVAEHEDDGDDSDTGASAASPVYEYGEFSRNASSTESEQPSASDDALDTDRGLTSGTYSQDSAEPEGFAQPEDVARSEDVAGPEGFAGPEGVAETEDSADVAQPEGVARPENLGGHDVGAGGEPLVAADAQEEFLSRWTQIQVSFLEDPPGAVESAEALIGEISAAIRTSLEERGNALATEGREASDTEQLRLALRQYRAFIGVILPK